MYPRMGLANKPHPPGPQIVKPAKRVQNRAVRARVQCVHGEITPPGVIGDIVRERHHGVASVGLNVLAKCRDLVGDALGNDGDRAVLNAGGNRFQAECCGKRHYPVR